MLVQRQAEAPAPIAEHATPAPETTQVTLEPTPAPSEVTLAVPAPVQASEIPAPAEIPEVPDEALSTLSPDQRERIERRIAKEVARRKTAEEDAARFKALANATPQPAPKPAVIEATPDNPLADVSSTAELANRLKAAKEAKFWAQEQLDREDLGDGVRVGERVYGKADLKTIVRNSDRLITEAIPDRNQFIQARALSERQTAEMFSAESWMQDRNSPGYQAYQQILADPAIQKRHDAPFVAAIQVHGLLDLQRRQKANGQQPTPIAVPVKPKAPASQSAVGGGFAPSRESSSGQSVKALEQEMERLSAKRGITGKETEKYLLMMEQARMTR